MLTRRLLAAALAPRHAVGRAAARALSTSNMGKRVLVTGAAGQIGTELVPYLEKSFGAGNVVASDVKLPPGLMNYPFCYLDVTNPDMMARVVGGPCRHSRVLSGIDTGQAREGLPASVCSVPCCCIPCDPRFAVWAPACPGTFWPTVPWLKLLATAVASPPPACIHTRCCCCCDHVR